MTKAELMELVGKTTIIHLKYEDRLLFGILYYADEFSARYGYRKPHHFYIGNISFLPSHVRKAEVLNDKSGTI